MVAGTEQAYQVYGVEPSSYTRKVLGLCAAKGVPHEFKLKSLAVKAEVEAACDGYALMPVVRAPDGSWLMDSTDIALRLDEAFPDTALLPDDPALAVVVRLLDDWADEWLIRPAVHWRASHAKPRAELCQAIARNLMGFTQASALPAEVADKLPRIAEKLEPFFAGIGRVNRAGPEHEDEIVDLLSRAFDLLAMHLARQPCLLGERVSLADFALYGMLEGQLLFDSAPRSLITERWPAIVAYVERLRTVRAGVGAWPAGESLPRSLLGLLRYIAEDFHGFLAANAEAVAAGANEASWDGMTMPARRYTERLRQEMAARIAALAGPDRARLEALVGGTGVLAVYQG
ncbi:glutathione S-transferase family protein [Parapedomonas caeni]